MTKHGLTADQLRDLYVRQNLPDRVIASMFGLSDVTVSNLRKKWGITTRSQFDRLTFQHQGPSIHGATRETLVQQYASETLRAIAVRYGVSKTLIVKRFEELGIPRVSKSERYLSNTTITSEQKQVIIGTLLGDAHVLPRGVLKLTHAHSQYDYLIQTRGVLASHVRSTYYEEKLMDNGRLTYGFGFNTYTHPWLKQIRQVFYPEGLKIYPESVLSSLSATSLAYWYFDDGHLDESPSIALGRIPLDSAKRVAALVSQRFHLQAYVRDNDETCRILRFKVSCCDRFYDLVSAHVPKDMVYKLPRNHRPSHDTDAIRPEPTHDPYLLPTRLVKDLKLETLVQFWEKVGYPRSPLRPEELQVLAKLTPEQVLGLRTRLVGTDICTHFLEDVTSDSVSVEIIERLLSLGRIPNSVEIRAKYVGLMPALAKVLVDVHCPVGGVVLSTGADHGGDMLGTLVSEKRPRYIGYASPLKVGGLTRLAQWVGSEDRVELNPGKLPLVDLVFVTPGSTPAAVQRCKERLKEGGFIWNP